MNWVFGGVAVTLGVVFLWGLLAPRSQWRVLASWSVADPHRNEPGGGAYGARRMLAALGLAGVVAVFAVASSPALLAQLPKDSPRIPPVQTMWGSPTPQLVDRVVSAQGTPPEGLVGQQVLGYQDLDDEDELPAYLLALRPFTLLGKADIPGYIGSPAPEGFAAIGSASIVVHVRGPVLCIPKSAVVIETETTVQVGVYYGLPDPLPGADGSVPSVDSVAGCPADAAVTGSVLVPLQLSAPVGDREVQSLDGTPIDRIQVVD